MNTDTGEIYQGAAAIEAARARGEPVVPVSARVVHLVRLGSQAEARAREKAKRKRKRKQQQESRRRNRR